MLRIRSIYFVLFLIASMIACQPEEIREPTPEIVASEQEDARYYYYLDGKPVIKGAYDMEDESLFIGALEDKEPASDGKAVFHVQAFSARQDYIDWGKSEGFKLEEGLLFEETMRDYIEREKVIEHFEKTGEAPLSYTAYEQAAFSKIMEPETQEKGLVFLGRDCYGAATHPMAVTFPFMQSKWNNNVSRVGIFSATGLIMFDKSFYRKRLSPTLMRRSIQYTNLCIEFTHLNDRMSSGLSLL